MMKERIFYLDFVRAIAVVFILITHFNAWYVFGREVPMYDKCVFFEYPFGIYVGAVGVSLFLIISGSALMYTYGDKLELKTFYKKRFVSIYPMFWIAYFVAFIPQLRIWNATGVVISKKSFILTVFGMDGYLSELGTNFFIVGEWFLGFIIIFYVIFPLLRVCINKNEVITVIAVVILYILSIRFYNSAFAISKFLPIRLPELVFGMVFIKHRFKVKWFIAVPASAVLVLNYIFRPEIHNSIQTTYVGLLFFIVLVYIADLIKNAKVIKVVCGFLSKFSYAIFLVHHVIINNVQAILDVNGISTAKSYALFAILVIAIMITSVLLYYANKMLTNRVGQLVMNLKNVRVKY